MPIYHAADAIKQTNQSMHETDSELNSLTQL